MEPIYRLEKVFLIIKIVIKKNSKEIKRNKKNEKEIKRDGLKKRKGGEWGLIGPHRRWEELLGYCSSKTTSYRRCYSTRSLVSTVIEQILVAAEDAEQAFHRAVGGQTQTDADHRVI